MDMTSMSSATAASPAASSVMPPPTAGMDMGGGDTCKITMLWNWYTIDACFLSDSWHVRSAGGFAGSCIGVVLLVMTLEALRRVSKEYEAHLIRRRTMFYATPTSAGSDCISNAKEGTSVRTAVAVVPVQHRTFKPNLLEQLTRSLLHMLQFAVAYFVMLLAMSFNGYIIICIFVGAFLGAFVFNWTSIGLP